MKNEEIKNRMNQETSFLAVIGVINQITSIMFYFLELVEMEEKGRAAISISENLRNIVSIQKDNKFLHRIDFYTLVTFSINPLLGIIVFAKIIKRYDVQPEPIYWLVGMIFFSIFVWELKLKFLISRSLLIMGIPPDSISDDAIIQIFRVSIFLSFFT